ncbi:MAG: acetyl-CoA carboxylase biotin carboxylase subunit [Hyphomicrobiaceae bacterium]
MPFTKILIANRGEISCRITTTARALGYRTVAVYSDADIAARHVAVADEAVRIGPAPVGASYLNIEALIDAAKRSGADAIHPGYGFLSENAAFAQACVDAGIIFIGPTPAAIAAMGNKAAAKRLMIEAGVPCVPGYHGVEQTDARLSTEAKRIGFPVMVKAAAGGGGRGMRLVQEEADLLRAFGAARMEALSAFGSDELILEKAVVDARHVEIQVFADAHGGIIHLGERDCSVQRRHQKVLEEAPSPAVNPGLRARMGAAAVAAARAIDYRGAGTVEFLLEPSGAFYFLEMNTRLQVEHPVTEMVTGLDLVAWQLRVAAGEPLPLTQADVRLGGHAIEARIYAEDPSRGFLPQTGRVLAWTPADLPAVRTDHGLLAGQDISPFYDPMLAKVIAHGATRDQARRKLIMALEETRLLGPTTNIGFLIAALRHPEFADGRATTNFIDQCFAKGSPALAPPVAGNELVALAAVLLSRASQTSAAVGAAWHSSGVPSWPMRVAFGATPTDVIIKSVTTTRYDVQIGGAVTTLDIVSLSTTDVRFSVDGHVRSAQIYYDDGTQHLGLNGLTYAARDILHDAASGAETDGDDRIRAPMNGRVVSVRAKAGDTVVKGQCIVILEAMKMQHELTVGRAGTLADVRVAEGDQVATQHILAVLAAVPQPSKS